MGSPRYLEIMPKPDSDTPKFWDPPSGPTEQEKAERIAFMKEHLTDKLIGFGTSVMPPIWWNAEGPILNSYYAGQILKSDEALLALWEECAHRGSFEAKMKAILGISDQ